MLIAATLQGTFKLSYTGHSKGWSDYGPTTNTWPIRFLWIEAIDSSWAEMQIIRADDSHDTITFGRLANGKWKLIRYMGRKDIRTLHDIDINQRNDSIKIGLGFGYSGVSYYARKDSE